MFDFDDLPPVVQLVFIGAAAIICFAGIGLVLQFINGMKAAVGG